MNPLIWIFGIIAILVFVFIQQIIWENTPEGKEVIRKARESNSETKDQKDAKIICPQCQEKGNVMTRMVDKKTGISGAKATAAVLTGGVSVLATGLSKKDKFTEAKCSNCGSTWYF